MNQNYICNIRFTTDTTSVTTAINNLKQNLNTLTAPTNTFYGFETGSQKAIADVQKLKAVLQEATTESGNLDLTRFSSSMQQLKLSAKDVAASLGSLGPQGQQAFQQLATAVAQAEVPLRKTNAILDGFARSLRTTATYLLSSSIWTGLYQGFSSAFQYAQDLNESLNNIRIVTGYSADKMAEFAVQANKAAKSLSTTTTEYTNASLIYYQQGLSESEVIERTNATIKMANVTGEAVEEVSNQLTSIWNNFDNGTKSLEYYVDVVTALGAATASSSDEIATGLEKFAAIAETVGLSYEYATAALATVTAETRQSAEVVGTAFKTLFARIQDLELGDTLEDGTTLGKYSEALNVIGVNIKDANGELKDMDVILNELGKKWDTLSKAQQVSTAQTVAGVRQYTQLIALMDNWDKFQQNVDIAQTSTGTLSAQAEIYEESWDAANKRVKASVEEVLNNLIDDKFFIKLIDGFSGFIDLIGDITHGLGGFKGVLSLIGMLFLKIFQSSLPTAIQSSVDKFTIFRNHLKGAKSDTQQVEAATKQTAQSTEQAAAGAGRLRNFWNKVTGGIQAASKQAQAMVSKQQWLAEATEMITQQYAGQALAGQLQIDLFKDKLNAQTQFLENAEQMTALERALVQIYMDQAAAAEQNLKTHEQDLQTAKEKAQAFASDKSNYSQDPSETNMAKMQGLMTGAENVGFGMAFEKEAIKILNSSDTVEAKMQRLQKTYDMFGPKIKEVAGDTKILTAACDHLGIEIDEDNGKIKKIDATLEKTGAGIDATAKTMEFAESQISSLGDEAHKAGGLFNGFFGEANSGPAQAFKQLLLEIAKAMGLVTNDTMEAANSYESVGAAMAKVKAQAVGMGQQITDVSMAFMQVSMVISSIEGMVDSIKNIADGTSTFTEELSSMISSVSSILLSGMFAFTSLQASSVKWASTAALAEDILIGKEWEQFYVKGEVTKEEAKQLALKNLTVTAEEKKLALQKASQKMMVGTMTTIGLVIAAVYAIGAAIDYMKSLSPEKQAQKLREEYEETKQVLDDIGKTIESDLDKFKELKDVNKTLEDLTIGTTEWYMAIQKANTELFDLLKTYNLFDDAYYTKDANGVYRLTSQGEVALENAMQEKMANNIAASSLNEINYLQESKKIQGEQFVKDNKLKTTGQGWGQFGVGSFGGTVSLALGAIAVALLGPIGVAAAAIGGIAAAATGVAATIWGVTTVADAQREQMASTYADLAEAMNDGRIDLATKDLVGQMEKVKGSLSETEKSFLREIEANEEAQESLLEFAKEMEIVAQQEKMHWEQIAESSFGQSGAYAEADLTGDRDLLNSLVAQRLKTATNEQYEKEFSKQTDKVIQQAYARAQGLTWIADKSGYGVFLNSEGEEVKVADETARMLLSQIEAKKWGVDEDAINRRMEDLQNENSAASRLLIGLLSGEGTGYTLAGDTVEQGNLEDIWTKYADFVEMLVPEEDFEKFQEEFFNYADTSLWGEFGKKLKEETSLNQFIKGEGKNGKTGEKLTFDQAKSLYNQYDVIEEQLGEDQAEGFQETLVDFFGNIMAEAKEELGADSDEYKAFVKDLFNINYSSLTYENALYSLAEAYDLNEESVLKLGKRLQDFAIITKDVTNQWVQQLQNLYGAEEGAELKGNYEDVPAALKPYLKWDEQKGKHVWTNVKKAYDIAKENYVVTQQKQKEEEYDSITQQVKARKSEAETEKAKIEERLGYFPQANETIPNFSTPEVYYPNSVTAGVSFSKEQYNYYKDQIFPYIKAAYPNDYSDSIYNPELWYPDASVMRSPVVTKKNKDNFIETIKRITNGGEKRKLEADLEDWDDVIELKESEIEDRENSRKSSIQLDTAKTITSYDTYLEFEKNNNGNLTTEAKQAAIQSILDANSGEYEYIRNQLYSGAIDFNEALKMIEFKEVTKETKGFADEVSDFIKIYNENSAGNLAETEGFEELANSIKDFFNIDFTLTNFANVPDLIELLEKASDGTASTLRTLYYELLKISDLKFKEFLENNEDINDVMDAYLKGESSFTYSGFLDKETSDFFAKLGSVQSQSAIQHTITFNYDGTFSLNPKTQALKDIEENISNTEYQLSIATTDSERLKLTQELQNFEKQWKEQAEYDKFNIKDEENYRSHLKKIFDLNQDIKDLNLSMVDAKRQAIDADLEYIESQKEQLIGEKARAELMQEEEILLNNKIIVQKAYIALLEDPIEKLEAQNELQSLINELEEKSLQNAIDRYEQFEKILEVEKEIQETFYDIEEKRNVKSSIELLELQTDLMNLDLQNLVNTQKKFNDINDIIKTKIENGETPSQFEVETYTEALKNYIKEYSNFEKTKQDILKSQNEIFEKSDEDFNSTIEKIEKVKENLLDFKDILSTGKYTLFKDGEFEKIASNINSIALQTDQNNLDLLLAERATYLSQIQNYNNLIAQSNNEEERKYYEDLLKTTKEKLDESNEAILSTTESALEVIQAQFELNLQRAVDSYASAISKYNNIENLKEAFDLQTKESEAYLDNTKKAYELNKLSRQINQDISNQTTQRAQNKLRDVLEEINKLQADKTKMTELELKNLQARYELRIAEIALEEAQWNKTQMRLQRNANGSWNYVYTTNEEAIAKAQQDLEDKQYNLYSQNLEAINQQSEQLLETIIDFQDKEKEIAEQLASGEITNAEAAEARALNARALEEIYRAAAEIKEAMDEGGISWLDTDLAKTSGAKSIDALINKIKAAEKNLATSTSIALKQFSKDSQGIFDLFGISAKTGMDSISDILQGTQEDISQNIEQGKIDLINLDSTLISLKINIVGFWENWSAAIENNLVPTLDTLEQAAGLLSTIKGYVEDGESDNTGDVRFNQTKKSNTTWKHSEAGVETDTVMQMSEEDFIKVNANREAWAGASAEEKEKLNKENQEIMKKYGYTYDAASGQYHKNGKIANLYGSVDARFKRFDTGGYTGEWGDSSGRLALLDEKELILNEEDTSNILSAVKIVRDLSSSILKDILVNAGSMYNLVGSLVGATSTSIEKQPIEQNVHIEANFPNVNSQAEIEMAFADLVNQAAQFASIKKL